AYLNKLIKIGFICCSKATTYEEEPMCFSSNLNVNKDITKNVNSAIYFLTHFLDTTQEYKGWKKLQSYFSENYLFERIPLKKVVYSDEFNFWDSGDIEFHRGNNYRLLENYITSQIIQNKTKITIPEKIVESMKIEYHPNISGDILANVLENKLILDLGIGSSRTGKIIGRFLQAYPSEAREKIMKFLQQSSPGNEIVAEVRYLFKNSKFASISNNINPYKYEINLNSTKSNIEQELDIDSLSVGLDSQGIYLWSEDLRQRVIPKFTNAVNGLAVNNKMYRFLFFLSRERYENFKPVLPEYLEERVWSPRLEYKDIIIRREQWKLDAQFMVEKEKNFSNAMDNWRSRYNVPRIVGISLGEAPTVFDLSNDLQLKTLKKIIHNSNIPINFVEVPEISEFHKNNIIQGVFSFYIANSKDKNVSQDGLSEY
ncbi:MAG: lantibiotic dehydratase family protein, partial [Lactobacillus sp.]|nr:lantibiotic dehydratase family protein [Lactobacillus sp.]